MGQQDGPTVGAGSCSRVEPEPEGKKMPEARVGEFYLFAHHFFAFRF